MEGQSTGEQYYQECRSANKHSTLSLFAALGTEVFSYFPPQITRKMLDCLVLVYHHSPSKIYPSADGQRKGGRADWQSTGRI